MYLTQEESYLTLQDKQVTPLPLFEYDTTRSRVNITKGKDNFRLSIIDSLKCAINLNNESNIAKD